ncbi:methyltransferase domain [Hokovirus HKV1]|uniref:Small RNA 2'-O-methyltransferase n=1 Tax=Hokovirus HKV1 TaxID=1977638 RepID=A0A1V0SF26_9VIRU|nr:methyltransferase domain [Hokovirus HKV1]
MAITLRSANNDLSYVIKKNPNTNRIDKLKNGTCIGYYTQVNNVINDKEYNIYFCENFNNISYNECSDDSESNYSNKMKFMSPLLILDMLNIYFADNFKKEDEKDLVLEQELIINLLYIKEAALKFIQDILDKLNNTDEIKILLIKKYINIYTVNIKFLGTINKMLNIIQSILCFIVIKNNFHPQICIESLSSRLSKSLYTTKEYLTYMHIYKILTLADQLWFKTLLPILQKPNMVLNSYKLAELRFRKTINLISNIKKITSIDNIIDIGCGNGRYLDLLTKFNDIKNYYCYDIDNTCIEKVNIKKQQFQNQIIVSNKNFPDNVEGNNIILLLEVIEHMDYDIACDFLNNIIDNINFTAILLSTPNRDFNKHYELNTFRHDDHKYELTKNEFETFINNIVKNRYLTYFYDVGDIVDNSSPTNYCVIAKPNISF